MTRTKGEHLMTKKSLTKPCGRATALKVERISDATAEALWSYWTDPEKYAGWFIPPGWTSKVTQLDVRVGGRYEITLNDGRQKVRNHGGHAEIVPNRRLAWTWNFDIVPGPDDKPYDVPLTVELEEVPDGTKMTFTQGPLATPEYTKGSREGILSNFDQLEKALEA